MPLTTLHCVDGCGKHRENYLYGNQAKVIGVLAMTVVGSLDIDQSDSRPVSNPQHQ